MPARLASFGELEVDCLFPYLLGGLLCSWYGWVGWTLKLCVSYEVRADAMGDRRPSGGALKSAAVLFSGVQGLGWTCRTLTAKLLGWAYANWAWWVTSQNCCVYVSPPPGPVLAASYGAGRLCGIVRRTDGHRWAW